MDTNPSPAPTEKDVLAQGVGQVIGELLGAFLGSINAIRKQPGFDDAAFRTEIEALLKIPGVTQLQEHAFLMLLQAPRSQERPKQVEQ